MGLWTDQDERANGSSYEWLHQPQRPAAPPPAPPPAPPAPPRRRRGLVAAIVAGILALSLGTSLLAVALVDGDAEREAVAPLTVSKGGTGETRIGEIYRRVEDSVVSIQVRTGGGGGNGSGFVIADDTIVTNDHVVENAQQVQVRFDDGADLVPAEVVGTDPSSDLAVLRVDPRRMPDVAPLTLADSKNVRVGDEVLAVGFPLGLDRTATAGIISGLGRTIQAPNNFSIDNVLQTDAPINPGNSGGPLLDSRGRVIGVNSQIATAGSQGNVGIGFAVPSNTVREVVPQLQQGREVRRAYLGVSTTPPQSGAGAQLARVNPGGPADAAGLRAGNSLTGAGGDVIVGVNGKRITSPDELTSAIGRLEPGDRAKVEFERDGVRRSTTVTLDQRPRSLPSSP